MNSIDVKINYLLPESFFEMEGKKAKDWGQKKFDHNSLEKLHKCAK